MTEMLTAIISFSLVGGFLGFVIRGFLFGATERVNSLSVAQEIMPLTLNPDGWEDAKDRLRVIGEICRREIQD